MDSKTLHSDIAWNALLREVRINKISLRHGGSSTATSGRKKRRQQDDDIADISNDRKIRCLRISRVGDVLDGSSSSTFLNLSPPSSTIGDELSFTFGRHHYKSISLPSLSKTSCACSGGSSSRFDIFSSYRCPCKKKTQSMSSKKKSLLVGASSRKMRGGDILY
ncbi:expressed unknown protein [Seminavis robusta]|uniref:Uncharacterized protein n=1 Tax=Seminavis robusta TaxID=568900 RepID=A0A9N8ER02_9STRA|nr:expressed unknown protein [Seminavis robusta]|eukprot:Sro1543_g281140.1 n/a (164) ;mRNA; r:11086-11577